MSTIKHLLEVPDVKTLVGSTLDSSIEEDEDDSSNMSPVEPAKGQIEKIQTIADDEDSDLARDDPTTTIDEDNDDVAAFVESSDSGDVTTRGEKFEIKQTRKSSKRLKKSAKIDDTIAENEEDPNMFDEQPSTSAPRASFDNITHVKTPHSN